MERKFTIGKKGSVWTVYDSHAALHVQDCGEGDKGHAEAKATCESWNARRCCMSKLEECTSSPLVFVKHVGVPKATERRDARTEFKKAWLERWSNNPTYPGEALVNMVGAIVVDEPLVPNTSPEIAQRINETIKRCQSKTALKTLGFDSSTLGTEWDGETELSVGMTVSGGILLYLDARNAIIKTDTGFTTMKREDVKPVTFRDGVTLGEAEEIERLAKIAYKASSFSTDWDDLYVSSKNKFITIAKTLRKEILK